MPGLCAPEMEQQSIRGCGRLFKGLFILILMDSLSWIQEFLERWQRSGAELHIFWRGRTGVQRGYKGAGRHIFSSTNGLNNMGSFKMFTGTCIITQCTT